MPQHVLARNRFRKTAPLWKRFGKLCKVLYSAASFTANQLLRKINRRGFCENFGSKPSSMTLQQFQSLPKDMQRVAIKRYGVFLFGRRAVGIHVMLYQVDGFYAELYFDESASGMSRIKSFDDTKYLEPYLHKVDVSALHPFLMK